uniref:Cytochrome c oxidase assembly protein COX11, mitochondrial n=1 Tax=Arion vulgaris TaxID=1028688 RepID=A0A0B7A7H2_9EUPU
MALMYTHGRQMFSTLKSPFLKFRKHLTVHKWTDLTPTVVQKLSAFQTGKSTPLSFRWFCLLPFSRTVCFTNRTFNNLAFKHINYKHILCLEQFTHKSLVLLTVRTFSTSTCRWAAQRRNIHSSNKTGLIYMVAILVFMLGGAYAGVPLYKVFCQASGLGGQAVKGHDTSNIESMEKVERPILVRFNADVASSMR